ncbi:MAG: 2TM domain-containing protein [Bacteroidota bacterium]
MDRAYKEAKKRVKAKKKFFKELTSYVVISLFLIFVNVFTNPSYLWCLWAIVPWGFGMVLQGIKIAASNKTSDWEQKEIRRELIAMGKDPDDYMDDELELRELDREELYTPKKGYRDSDLV